MLRRTVAVILALTVTASVFPAAQSSRLTLPDGTRVRVRLLQTISSDTSKSGEPVNLEVVEDIVADGVVVIKQGTPVSGTIAEAEPARRMGRAGKLIFVINETKSVDGKTVRLRSTQSKQGEGHVTGVVVATTISALLLWPIAPLMLLRRGKPVGAVEGTRFEAFVDGDHAVGRPTTLDTDVETEPRVAPAAAPGASSVMRNDDVTKLAAVGIGEDVIVSKIRKSATAFQLDADDLIALKNAGISDRVLAAMLEAQSTQPGLMKAPKPSEPASRPERRERPVVTIGAKEEWQTNLPGTHAYMAASGTGLRLDLAGSSEFGGYGVELRPDGDAFTGSASAPGCVKAARWWLQRQDGLWMGRFQCEIAAGHGRAVGFILSRTPR